MKKDVLLPETDLKTALLNCYASNYASDHEIQYISPEKKRYERETPPAAGSAKKHEPRVDGCQKQSAECNDKYIRHRETSRKGYEDKAVSGTHRSPG